MQRVKAVVARVIRATTSGTTTINHPMQITHDQLYHVYNRGNNQQRIFYSPQHYFYFIEKMKAHLVPVADMLAWCLMPNHFHLLLQLRSGTAPQQFSSAFRVLLSSIHVGSTKKGAGPAPYFSRTARPKHCMPVKAILIAAFNTFIRIRLGQAS